MLDPYSILGVDKNATFEEIRIAYKKLAQKYHPDSFNAESSNEKMAEINAAYDYIKENYKGKKSNSSSFNTYTYKNYTQQEKRRTWKTYNNEMNYKINESIELIKVVSSNVDSIGFDNIFNVLYVKFKDSSLYCYFDVSEDVFRAFLSSSSKGRFLYYRIEPYYRYKKIK